MSVPYDSRSVRLGASEEPTNYYTGLIGYTVGGVPFPLDPQARIHKSVLDDASAHGELPLQLFFTRQLEDFQKAVWAYQNEYEKRAEENQRAPTWERPLGTSPSTGPAPVPVGAVASDGASGQDAPLPTGTNARKGK